jgi:hypothetical protein
MRIEYENNRIPIYRTMITEEDEENILTKEDMRDNLKEIADDLGYTYIETRKDKLGDGKISISDDVNIRIKYNEESVNHMDVTVGKGVNRPSYDVTDNSATIDEISVALQTASMICSEIRRKLM